MSPFEVCHTTGGSGDWMACWQWEFQKLFQCMGWTYYLYFTTEELANKWLNECVKPSFPGIETQVKQRMGSRDIVSK